MQVFISHSHKDHAFVKHLAEDLERHGIDVWYDEWEMKPGDSLTAKIGEGIKSSGYLVIVLSKNSVSSNWVEKELSLALSDQLARKSIKVIPILRETCEFPRSFHFLGDTIYADFRGDYDSALKRLLAGIGVRPSRRGIKLFRGNPKELKVHQTGAITIARYEGLEFLWDFDRLTKVLSLYLSQHEQTSDPVLEIPLTKKEVLVFHAVRRKGGWGYYDLTPPIGRFSACVNVCLVTAEGEAVNKVWFIDGRRRRNLRMMFDIFVGIEDPIFGSDEEQEDGSEDSN